jgi:RNA polymerase sigma-70 factor (ECF subfamily)
VTASLDFARVYAEQADYVRRLLQRMGIRAADLDDVVQDTFVTIYRLLPGFEGRASLETWLYAVCWRTAARYHRRVKPRDIAAEVSPSSFSIDTEFGAATMMASLEGVEPRDLDVFVLHEIGGLSISELSDLTGQARATLRRHLERARKTIQRKLGQDGIAPTEASRAPLRSSGRCEDVPLVYVTPDVCISQHGNTVLTRWRGPSRTPALQVLFEFLARACRETTDRITYMSIIEPDSPPPDREGRAVVRRCIELAGPRSAAAAFLALGPGVLGIVPPIINAAVFLSRTPMNSRFFSDQRLALQWLSQFVTGGETFESLREHVQGMERLIDEAEAANQERCSASPSKYTKTVSRTPRRPIRSAAGAFPPSTPKC